MITVSLGVGENPQKRLSDPFEPELLALLAETGLSVLIDKGGIGYGLARTAEKIPEHTAEIEAA